MAMKKLVIGILAHVDAGKTTLSEAVLYHGGSIRKMGRVDNKDAFLDTYALERDRGITIFSKQALFRLGDIQVTLLDTPGHVDFSAEMERTLQVLDYAVLVINGADGVQGHTRTLWRLLAEYGVPVFLFINKMDQLKAGKEMLLQQLKQRLHGECTDFTHTDTEEFYENVAVADERTLEIFLENGSVGDEEIQRLVRRRKIFPCFFGSALKNEGVGEFLQGLCRFVQVPVYGREFAAKVFKIGRDAQGNRLTFLKVTGGMLRTKAALRGRTGTEEWEEKIHQIRIYSGEKYNAAEEVSAGDVCAVLGLSKTYAGEGLGAEKEGFLPVLEPVMTYRMILPEGLDASLFLPKLRQLEEEEPLLHIVWDGERKEIQAKIMGEVQTEVLGSMIQERFGIVVGFGTGNIVYKETIAGSVEGVGHFEPLRHYAEVHLLLEAAEPGCGLKFAADCSEDELDRNWQRLVLTHLEEKEHKGVLTGAPITDMRITLVAGRAHQKHTEGGDFRQATYRALRQGLMEAQSVLLEPYYDFRLEVPEGMTGRAMTDMEKRSAVFGLPAAENGMTVLCGKVPAVAMLDYQKELAAYTRGVGKLSCTFRGYEPCHNAQEVVESTGYEPERDLENPSGSVFCAHGAGFVVEWDRVKEYMHVESPFPNGPGIAPGWGTEPEDGTKQGAKAGIPDRKRQQEEEKAWLGTEEVDAILDKACHANRKKAAKSPAGQKDNRSAATYHYGRQQKPPKKSLRQEEFLLVDGYNIIHAWEDLRELAAINIDGARGKLMDILCNYQGVRGIHLIVVFDAYRVQGHETEILDYHNIHVVYTKEAETADQYIEKFAHENGRRAKVTVVTSDGMEQIIIRGQGCTLISAREFREEVKRAGEESYRGYVEKQKEGKQYLLDAETADRMKGEVGKNVPERHGKTEP